MDWSAHLALREKDILIKKKWPWNFVIKRNIEHKSQVQLFSNVMLMMKLFLYWVLSVLCTFLQIWFISLHFTLLGLCFQWELRQSALLSLSLFLRQVVYYVDCYDLQRKKMKTKKENVGKALRDWWRFCELGKLWRKKTQSQMLRVILVRLVLRFLKCAFLILQIARIQKSRHLSFKVTRIVKNITLENVKQNY